MHVVKGVRDFARVLYGTDEPTKSQLNTVTKMCRDGSITHATKMCSRWMIDMTAEWPDMFPDEADFVLSELQRLSEAVSRLTEAVEGKEAAHGLREGGAA